MVEVDVVVVDLGGQPADHHGRPPMWHQVGNGLSRLRDDDALAGGDPLDIWVWTSPSNAAARLGALTDFRFAAVGLVAADVTEPGRDVQLGYPPVRVDLLTSIDGVEFEECFDRRVEVGLDGLPVPFIALDDLRRNKASSGRPQDLADLDALGS